MTLESPVVGLSVIVALGMLAQWLAWRFKLPSILILLVFGIFAGPVLTLLDPEKIFGDLLFPIVSISVAIILFEGGLELKFSELSHVGRPVRNLVTIGALLTWVLTAFIANIVLQLDFALSMLLGAILVVTGPTVIGPLLRHVRPVKNVSSVLKWEGIVIDPIGAMLAVLVFEVIHSGSADTALSWSLLGIFKTLGFGAFFGILGAMILLVLIKQYWLPDFLQSPVTLMLIILVYSASNLFQAESGLLSATIMGIVLANQKKISLKRIVEFKESLRVLIISSLFIILAARLKASDVSQIDWRVFVFILLLIVLIRPLSVFASTLKSQLTFNQKLFISFMAPRGIVAAAVASVFSFELLLIDYPGAERIAPIVFAVIISTVAFYSLTAPLLSKKLKVAAPKPQGILIIGAHSWARALGEMLKKENFRVLLVDTNYFNMKAAHMLGLEAQEKNILIQADADSLDLSGIGRLFALTPNDEVNSLATLRFASVFGEAETYQLAPQKKKTSEKDSHTESDHLWGRFLFGENITFAALQKMFDSGAVIKKTPLTEEFGFEDLRKLYGADVLPLFSISPAAELSVVTADKSFTPKKGHSLVSIAFAQNAST